MTVIGPPFLVMEKISLTAAQVPFYVYSKGPGVWYQYLPLPVAKCLALAVGSREAGNVRVHKVCISLGVTFAVDMQVLGLCYPVSKSMMDQRDEILVGGDPPTFFEIGVKALDRSFRLMTVEETRFLETDHGPFAVWRHSSGQRFFDSGNLQLWKEGSLSNVGAPR
jgi:hypothetical protein